MAQVDTNIQNPNDPNNPNNPTAQNTNQVQTQNANQPATSGGAGAVTSTGAGNVTGQVVGTNNPSQPFQNISSYLAANAPQSAALAGQVAGSVSQPIAQTAKDITNSSQNFTNAVNAGYTPEDKNMIATAAANPVAAANDPNSLAAFQKQLNDAYTGPTDFSTDPAYSGLSAEVANAQGLGTNAQTPTGIQTLLRGAEAPDYTQGINNLDTLLLAQNPGNFKTISNAGTAANAENNNLGNFLAGTTASNNNVAKSAAAQAAQAAADAKAPFTGTNGLAPTLQNTLNSELQSDVGKTNDYNTKIQNILAELVTGNPLSPDIANLIDPGNVLEAINPGGNPNAVFPDLLREGFAGISPDMLANYYTGPSLMATPSLNDVITPDQAATAQALNKLLNTTAVNAPASAPTTPFSIPAVAGTYRDKDLLQDLYNTLGSYSSPYMASLSDAQLAAYFNDFDAIAGMLGIPRPGNPNPTPLQPGQPGPPPGPPGGDAR